MADSSCAVNPAMEAAVGILRCMGSFWTPWVRDGALRAIKRAGERVEVSVGGRGMRGFLTRRGREKRGEARKGRQ